jgi:hypothetical protein
MHFAFFTRYLSLLQKFDQNSSLEAQIPSFLGLLQAGTMFTIFGHKREPAASLLKTALGHSPIE